MITLLLAIACNSGSVEMNQGFGSVYTTTCSSRMSIEADVYTADCTPPPCHTDFEQVALSHVVVAVDPGEKVVGSAQRTCVQTLQKLQESEPVVLETQDEPTDVEE